MMSPCYKCEGRAENCHSFCERYLEYRKAIDDVNKNRRDFNNKYVSNKTRKRVLGKSV